MPEDNSTTTEYTSAPQDLVPEDQILHELEETLDHILYDPEPYAEDANDAPVSQITATEEEIQESAEAIADVSAEPVEQAPIEPAAEGNEAPVSQIKATEEDTQEPSEPIEDVPAEPVEEKTQEPAEQQNKTPVSQVTATEESVDHTDKKSHKKSRAASADACQVAYESAGSQSRIPMEPDPVAEGVPAGTKKRGTGRTVALSIVLAVIIALIVFVIVFCVVFEGVYIVGTSMMPTFTGAEDADTEGGDYVYANRYRKPTYGDVVIVQETESKIIIKRVIAMGGDTVKMEQGTVYVQYAGTDVYTALEEDYVAPENCTGTLRINSQAAHTVAEGCIYCLGDNRDVSSDSRQNGDFSLDSVLGVVPNWMISIKTFTTRVYNLVHF